MALAQPHTDYCILTMREDEFQAVIERLGAYDLITGASGRHYAVAEITVNSEKRRIAVTRFPPGNRSSQVACREVLADMNPRFVFLCGIAGGVPSSYFGLGDVVVSDYILDFTLSAANVDSSAAYAATDTPSEKVFTSLLEILPAIRLPVWNTPEALGAERPEEIGDSILFATPAIEERWRPRLENALAAMKSRRQSRIVQLTIGSSATLLRDPERLLEFLAAHRRLGAVDMEAAGMLQVLSEQHVPFLVVHGLSDVVGVKRVDAWTPYACATAASYLMALLKDVTVDRLLHPPATNPQKLNPDVEADPPKRVASIHLTGIACFENLSLDFIQEEATEPAPWILFLGENGTGKSTLLQMIGATLLDRQQFAVVAGNIDLKSYIRAKPDAISEGTCSLGLWFKPADSDGSVYEVSLSLSTPPQDDSLVAPHVSSSLTGGGFICGYGTTRRISGQAVSNRGPIPTLDDSAKPYRFASLFGDPSGMTNVSEWLAGLFFRTLYPKHTEAEKEQDEERFENARAAILRALPHMSALEVTQDRQVMVMDGNTRVPLERLSDGYRGTLAWVGDLIRRLFDAFPDSSDPLKEYGVVLVDEIDLHLHPRWQRTVVEDIRKLFPNLQFIATTHSPFVAQDMRPQDRIVVLERSGRGRGPVVAREEPGVLQDWSADQILSAYFNLPRGTRSDAVQRTEARYQRLLDAQATRTLTKAESTELEKLGTQIDRIPIGATPDEQAFDRAAEKVLASLRQRHAALMADRQKASSSEENAN